MITERQVALDLGMRLRRAGVNYPDREGEWENYDTSDVEVAMGKSRIYRDADGWLVERKTMHGGRFLHNFGRSYGDAMDKFVAYILQEFGYAVS